MRPRKRGTAPKTLAPVRSNAALESTYQRKLDRAVSEMHNSYVYWLRATWRAKPPEMAHDGTGHDVGGWEPPQDDTHWTDGMSSSRAMQTMMGKLARRWQSRFDVLADELATWFAHGAMRYADAALKSSLKKAGFIIDWKMTKAQNDVFQAIKGEQVSLIKSIAQGYHSQVEGMVYRAVAAGGNVDQLAIDLGPMVNLELIGKGRRLDEDGASLAYRTRKRAILIARDQNSKANAVLTKARCHEIGITEAIWVHSAGGREPREEHVAWGDEKKVYQIAEGMYSKVDKEFVWPGTPIHCHCWARPILPKLPKDSTS